MRRVASLGSLAILLALSTGGVSAHAATGAPHRSTADRAPARSDAACIREGLAPIPVVLRAGAAHTGSAANPVFEAKWSGQPLPAGCKARRTVAIDFTLWFPHLRFVYTEGFATHWLVFFAGRQVERDEERRWVGPIYNPLKCIRKARARLRYEVVEAGGKVLGRRVVSAPVKLPACAQ